MGFISSNIVRIDNAPVKLLEHLEEVQAKLDDLHRQIESAKIEVSKPFAPDAELQQKSACLAELDAAPSLGGDAGKECLAA